MTEHVEIGFREVDDPFDGQPLVVAVNTRTDIIERLFHREKIDNAQFKAGRKFLHLVQKAEGSANLVVDMAREPVDCGSGAHDIPEHRLDAARELVRVSQRIGRRDYHLARRLIASDINAYRAPRTKREREYQCRRLKDLLDELAEFWHFASPTN